ncbi:extracellular solute-binding protein [Aerococcaceae bacterium zg-BR9]|uniref:extracellular solute-binding protein n=1 Tax=Aerococcaceae bacterium zg-1292 TaxID=2774330 RepID=UPI0040639534|nr:extracellular solute-binding protein [Aerococcaceae bacterium zg-BR9]
MNKRNIKISKLFISILLIICSAQTILAKENEGYQHYLRKNENAKIYEGEEIAHRFEKGLKIENQKENSFVVDAPESAWYYFGFDYQGDSESVLPFSYKMKIDGEVPFVEAENLILRTNWSRRDSLKKDRFGNEIIPDVEQVSEIQEGYIADKTGLFGNNMSIYLEKGRHTIDIKSIEGSINIYTFYLKNRINNMANKSENIKANSNGNNIAIEGENIYRQNASYIRPISVYNNKLSPYNNKFKVLNTLDGTSYKNVGDKVEYEFEVPEDGVYYLSLNYEQSAQVDFPVFLEVLIDNKIYSENLLSYGIPYNRSYGVHTFQKDNKEKIAFSLSKGKHIISFEITRKPLAKIINEIEDIITEINQLSREIELILGGMVDKNRDINLNEYIDNVPDKIIKWADRLAVVLESVKELSHSEKTPGAFNQIELAEKQLRQLASKPRTIANRWNELSKGGASITSKLAGLLQSQLNNGISIDKLWLHQDKIEHVEPNVFTDIVDGLQRFYYSFKKQDYSINQNSENLQVWVNRPRQYIEILQALSDQYFTSKTGIKVDFSLMPNQNKLILANTAGKQPDVALGVGYALPFDLAIRDALADLTEFPDYDEVVSSIVPNLLIPGMIGEKSFAIPETMNFYVMFYRKDILEQVGMEVPETIQDMAEMMPVLKQRGMGIFYPTASLGTSFKIFPWTMPIVYQNGGMFFGDTILESGLENEKTIEGIKMLTDLFTVYSLPIDVPSFYQEFRNGTIPLGISDFGSYNLMLNAAPEIANLWDIALMPGLENKNNQIERWSSGGAESSVMFDKSDKKDQAWEFLKWWHSKETQLQFGTTLQTYYGQEYMWNTANLDAFAELPWSSQHKDVILKQSEWIMEVPRVLGGYMVEREVSRLYTSVVIDGDNLRKSNDLSIKRISREIVKKLEEFGYMRDGNWIENYQMPRFFNDQN